MFICSETFRIVDAVSKIRFRKYSRVANSYPRTYSYESITPFREIYGIATLIPIPSYSRVLYAIPLNNILPETYCTVSWIFILKLQNFPWPIYLVDKDDFEIVDVNFYIFWLRMKY